MRGIILLGFLSGIAGALGKVGDSGNRADCSPQTSSASRSGGGGAGDLDRDRSRIYLASISKSPSPGEAGRGLFTFGGVGFLLGMDSEFLFERGMEEDVA